MKITRFTLTAVLWIGLLAATRVGADTHYVALGGQTPASPYTSWATAATNIQDAVVAAGSSDTVLVSNGVYQTGGTNYSDTYLPTNRVAITGGQIVRSVNGPAVTIIKGKFHSGEPRAAGTVTNGMAAVRCAVMSSGSLIGFTLTNGATWAAGEGANFNDRIGGAVWCLSTSPIISNCVIVGNSGQDYAGGVQAGTLYNCLLTGNSSPGQSGGAGSAILYNCLLTGNSSGDRGGGGYGCTFYNCLIAYNSAKYGGGADLCTIYNCTIVSNSSPSDAGGVRNSGIVCNSIIYFNTSGSVGYSNWGCNTALNFTNCCTAPAPVASGQGGWAGGTMSWTNLVTNDPQFVSSASGNYRLANTSPCINTATNFSWMISGRDLDGYRRLDKFSGLPDIGCYEYVPKGTIYRFH